MDRRLEVVRRDVCSDGSSPGAIQVRFWKRVVELYWRSGWSTPEIANQFGVGKERVRAVVKALRREARRFFGDGQSLQPSVHKGQAAQSIQPKNEKQKPPIAADPGNDSQQHWEDVLDSYGLGDPDVPMPSLHARGPVYKFAWRSTTSAESWAEFYEGASQVHKPRLARLAKSGPRKQIGVKTVEIDGQTYQVKIFEPGRPAGCFRFWASPRRKQAAPDREYDAEETKNILAHLLTAHDVEAAIDGDQEAREFLEQYQQIQDEKSSPLRGVEVISPTSRQATQSSSTRLVGHNEECVEMQEEEHGRVDLPDSVIHQQCENGIERDVVDLSGLRVVRNCFAENSMNHFMPNPPEGNQTHAA